MGVSWRRSFPVKICRSSHFFSKTVRPSCGYDKKITRKGARMVGSIPPSLEWIGAPGRKYVPPGHKKVWPAIPAEVWRHQSDQSVNHGEFEFVEFPRKIDHGFFGHRKFPRKQIGQSENCGHLFLFSLCGNVLNALFFYRGTLYEAHA